MDERYRALTVGRILLEGLQAALATKERAERQPHAAPLVSSLDNRGLLDSPGPGPVPGQGRLQGSSSPPSRPPGRADPRQALPPAFAGRGVRGATTRPARAAPSAVSPTRWTRASTISCRSPRRPKRGARAAYLWRFWRHIPARRQFTIFDRSWYGPRAGGAHRRLLRTGRLATAPMARSMTSRSSSASTGSSW